jgi:nitrite reductase/ring-hydroxylating ferredoxin subunit
VEPTGPATTTWTCAAGTLGPGQSVKFELTREGRRVHAFLVNHDGGHHAYINRCPHTGTPLDCWPNEFFTEDARYLICATHGAVFEPDTGVCLEGPCPGARLERLPVAVRGNEVVVGP